MKYLLNRGVAKLLGEEWHTAPLDEQIETYEYLRGLVDKNKAGWMDDTMNEHEANFEAWKYGGAKFVPPGTLRTLSLSKSRLTV